MSERVAPYGRSHNSEPGIRCWCGNTHTTAQYRERELHNALGVLAQRFSEEEAANAGSSSAPVSIAYHHGGFKITIERSK